MFNLRFVLLLAWRLVLDSCGNRIESPELNAICFQL